MAQGGYLSTDPNAGTPVPRAGGRAGGAGPAGNLAETINRLAQKGKPDEPVYLSTDPAAGESIQPEPQVPEPSRQSLSSGIAQSFADFGHGLWNFINPMGLIDAASHPGATMRSLLQQQGAQYTKAQAELQSGNYGKAAEHLAAWLVPVFGPAVQGSIEKIRSGNVSEGLGELSSFLVPSMAKGVKLTVPGIKGPANPAVAEAVEAGRQAGIPVDLATATGNRAVAGVQHIVDRSFGGSMVAKGAEEAAQQALAKRGRQLAADAYPKGPVTPETAGANVVEGVRKQAAAFQETANAGYDRLRALEKNPKNQRSVITGETQRFTGKTPEGNEIYAKVPVRENMGFPVDLREAKRQLRPMYDQLKRQYPVTQAQSSPGLKALENIIDGPDFAPLSQVDADLGAIKTLARSDVPGFKTQGQGTAATGIAPLERAISRTVAEFGQNIGDTLKAGRIATTAKYEALKLFESFKYEPVKAFKQATETNDAAIGKLREIQQQSPDVVPQIGRALLDQFMDAATSEGGFKGAQGLQAKWQNIGPQTKRLLFGDPAYIKSLDQFFLLAKKMAENPNPSGTAHTAALTAQAVAPVVSLVNGQWMLALGSTAVQVPAYAVAKLMHSPRGVRALMRGMTIPKSNAAAATAATVELTNAARAAGVPMSALGVAESQSTSKRDQP